MNNPWSSYFCGFSPTDGTVDFYTRIGCFVRPDFKVLDLGAGRASWFESDENTCRRSIRLLKGRVAWVVAADVDPVVLHNKSVNEAVVLTPGGGLPFEDASFDLVIADYVLEHVESPTQFASEISRILRPGGLFAARTPHKWCYVAVIARMVNNASHANLLQRIQPDRDRVDVFPTQYRLNTLKDISSNFHGFKNFSFLFQTDPAYYFGSSFLFYIQQSFHRWLPSLFSSNIFVFLLRL